MFKKLLVEYIKEKAIQSKNKELHVYDFDHTLYKEDSKTWIEETVSAARNSISHKNTISIICTAREKNQKEDLHKHLLTKNLKFDDVFMYNKKEPVSIYKSNVVEKIINSSNFKITNIVLWEDNEENISEIEKLASLREIPVQIFHVKK